MEKRYIIKQEKGSSIYDIAIKVAESLGVKSPSIDFADHNGWCDDDIFDVSLIKIDIGKSRYAYLEEKD